MAGLNPNVQVVVIAEDPPVTGAAFGTPAIMANPGEATFAERIRFYSTATEVEADRVASDISDDLSALLKGALSQSPHTPLVGAIRADSSGVAQRIQWTIAGAILVGEAFTIAINGIEFTHIAVIGLLTPTDIAAALVIGLDLLLIAAGTPVTASAFVADIIAVADTSSDFFDYYSSTDSVAGTISQGAVDAGIEVAASLALAAVESSDWYGLTLQSYATDHLDDAATWTEANDRLFIGQSNDPSILTTSTADIASTLAAQSLKRTAIVYHPIRDEQVALDWMATTLAADPDAVTTIWAYKTLEGDTPSALTSTEKINMDGKGANIYSTFFGQGATGEGTTADGEFIDTRITIDWVTARSAEAFASLMLRVSNLNSKVPYNDLGIEQAAAVVRGVLLRGEAVGHFNVGSSSVIKPLAANVPSIDKAARLLRLDFIAQRTDAIQNANINGSLVFQLPG